ncbi:MAG TPA: hypothetical protein VE912_18625 [Bacteroidales bacterium]|nr:hypothetical protein [Bacteroidales bacterium]
MKTFKSILFITFFVVGLTSCDSLNNLADVVFTASFSKSFPVSLQEGNNSVDEVDTLNFTDDSDVYKYRDKLKDVKIDSVKLQVLNYQGDANNTITGSVMYSSIASSTGKAIASINGLSLDHLSASGEMINLPLNSANLNDIGSLLQNDKKIKVYLKGNVDSTPASFVVKVYVYNEITANALK